MVLWGKEGILSQFYKWESVLRTNRHKSFCGTLGKRRQNRERKFRLEVISGLQTLNIQSKITSKRAREAFPKHSTSYAKTDGWGTLPSEGVSPYCSWQELSQPNQSVFWQLKPEVLPLVLLLPKWPWEYLPIRLPCLCNLGHFSRQFISKKRSSNHVTTGHWVPFLNEIYFANQDTVYQDTVYHFTEETNVLEHNQTKMSCPGRKVSRLDHSAL